MAAIVGLVIAGAGVGALLWITVPVSLIVLAFLAWLVRGRLPFALSRAGGRSGRCCATRCPTRQRSR